MEKTREHTVSMEWYIKEATCKIRNIIFKIIFLNIL